MREVSIKAGKLKIGKGEIYMENEIKNTKIEIRLTPTEKEAIYLYLISIANRFK